MLFALEGDRSHQKLSASMDTTLTHVASLHLTVLVAVVLLQDSLVFPLAWLRGSFRTCAYRSLPGVIFLSISLIKALGTRLQMDCTGGSIQLNTHTHARHKAREY